PTPRSPDPTWSRSSSTSPARRCGTDMRQLLTMAAADVRQRVRDRSVLVFGIVVPIALMFVLDLVFGDMEQVDLGEVTVAAALGGVRTEVAGPDVTAERVAAEEVRPRAEAGEAQLGIVAPPGFGAAVTSGQGATVDIVEGDGAGLETDILISVVRGVTDRMTAGTVAATAGAELGLDPAALGRLAQEVAQAPPVVTTVEGRTASEQLDPGATMV